MHVLKVFHRTERSAALTTAHTDAHNTKHKARNWVIVNWVEWNVDDLPEVWDNWYSAATLGRQTVVHTDSTQTHTETHVIGQNTIISDSSSVSYQTHHCHNRLISIIRLKTLISDSSLSQQTHQYHQTQNSHIRLITVISDSPLSYRTISVISDSSLSYQTHHSDSPVTGSHWRRFYFRRTSVFSALEVFYENALYKFTFDIDIDIDHCHIRLISVISYSSLSHQTHHCHIRLTTVISD